MENGLLYTTQLGKYNFFFSLLPLQEKLTEKLFESSTVAAEIKYSNVS